MQGMRETQLTANIELLPSTETAKQKQSSKPPISMNFEVSGRESEREWCNYTDATFGTRVHAAFYSRYACEAVVAESMTAISWACMVIPSKHL